MLRTRKRSRGANWTPEERKILLELVREKKDIIDKKCWNSETNVAKAAAWDYISERYLSFNVRPRTVQELKVQWKLLKLNLRSNNSSLDEELAKNGVDMTQIDDSFKKEVDISFADPDLKQDDEDSSEWPYNGTEDRLTSEKGDNLESDLEKEPLANLRSQKKYTKTRQSTISSTEARTLIIEQLQEEHELKLKYMRELHQAEMFNAKLKRQNLMLENRHLRSKLDKSNNKKDK